jgi:hypothetical protein
MKKCILILFFFCSLYSCFAQSIRIDPKLVGKNVTPDELDLKITGSNVLFDYGTSSSTNCNSTPILLPIYGGSAHIKFINSLNNTFSFGFDSFSDEVIYLRSYGTDSILGRIDAYDVVVGDNNLPPYPVCSVSCNNCFEVIDFSIDTVKGNFCSGGKIYIDYTNNSSASFASDNVFTVNLVNTYYLDGWADYYYDTITNIGSLSSINSGSLACLLPNISSNMVLYNQNVPLRFSNLYITGSSPTFKSENILIPYYSSTNVNIPELCVITVDNNGDNKVLWNNNSVVNSASVVVYKETSVSGIYDSLATMSINNKYYIDSLALSAVTPSTYAVKVIDSCNRLSQLSAPHKTMHLTLNTGQNNAWNLIWSHYSGTNVASYRIWRGTSYSNLAPLDSVAGSTYTYSDLTPPSGQLFYQIEAIVPQCNTISRSSSIVTSKSNVVENGIMTNLLNTTRNLNIYPNPFSSHTTIELSADPHTLTIYDIVGNKVREEQVMGTTVIEKGGLIKGLYILEVRSLNQTYLGKLLVK